MTDLTEAVITEVAAERRRQQQVEGWTAEHDDQHNRGEMAKAAACYAWASQIPDIAREAFSQPPRYWRAADAFRRLWPWPEHLWKPKHRRRDLIRAAALIVAEIERLDRAQETDRD